ncbi:MAG: iron-sulfur cluster assembly scaffold protein [Candidatus Micrarchaeota archaeon]
MDDYERIIALYRQPHNLGKLAKATHRGAASNSNCGDEIALELRVADGKIAAAKFTGVGCAMSIACASLLTDKLKGMNVEAAGKISEADASALAGSDLSKNPGRKKCALLAHSALRDALK